MTERELRQTEGTDPAEAGSVPEETVDELTRQRDEYLDSLRRLKAEFDNFRKRTENERAAQAAASGGGNGAEPSDDEVIEDAEVVDEEAPTS